MPQKDPIIPKTHLCLNQYLQVADLKETIEKIKNFGVKNPQLLSTGLKRHYHSVLLRDKENTYIRS